jgi:ATP-dependent DNA helicase PIF1
MYLGLCLPRSDSPIEQIIEKVYDSIDSIDGWSESMKQVYFGERVILAPLNADVDEINDACIERLPGQAKTFLSIDAAINDSGYQDYALPNEYLNTMDISGLPRHSITLKIGCPIILLRNLDPPAAQCNGTRLIVTGLGQRLIEAKILSGIRRGESVFIPRISTTTASSSRLPFTLRRHQFPIRVAFGMSINKSQGQSLLHVGIYLHTPVFAHGQLYVALSRAKDHRNIHISLSSSSNKSMETDNIVYLEVLNNSM